MLVLQGHLMATQDPSAMLIQWVTKNAPNPTVKWGLTSGQYTSSNVVSASASLRPVYPMARVPHSGNVQQQTRV